jgi:hypothetical protein
MGRSVPRAFVLRAARASGQAAARRS